MVAPNELQVNPWPGGLVGIPWAEFVTKSGTTQDASFGYEGGNQATFTIQVYYHDLTEVIRLLLGSNKWGVSGAHNLERIIPAPHPVYPTFLCDRIMSCRPYHWIDKVDEPEPDNLFSGTAISNYEFAIITAKFSLPHWLRTIEDNTLDSLYPPIGGFRQEYRRFLSLTPNPTTTTFQTEPNTWRWAETGEGGPTVGEFVTNPIAIRLGQIDYLMTWYRVPYHGLLLGPDYTRATNLEFALGKVNDDEFMGFPTGTLLFKGYRMIPVENPNPFDIDPAFIYDKNLLVNVELCFGFFDPDYGDTARGWNLSPFRGNNRWYLITASNGGRRLLKSVSFPSIFRAAEE